jgi:hypothetical protein
METIKQRVKKQYGTRETWKESFEAEDEEVCPICGGQGYIIKHNIVSSEYSKEKLLNFDEGIGSRIIEMCKNFTVEMQGRENNYRLR